jgi:hypothetical protein
MDVLKQTLRKVYQCNLPMKAPSGGWGKSSVLLSYPIFNAPPLAIEFQGTPSTGTVSPVVRFAFHWAK